MTIEKILGNPPSYMNEWIRKYVNQVNFKTPFYFEGQESGATVKMVAIEVPYGILRELQCHLEYSTNNMTTWQTYTGEIIELDNCIDNRVYFRAPAGQPNTDGFFSYYSSKILHYFKLEKAMKAGGNI